MRIAATQNMLWVVSQTQKEMLVLTMAAGNPAATDGDIAHRFDLLLSRMALLRDGPQARYPERIGHRETVQRMSDALPVGVALFASDGWAELANPTARRVLCDHGEDLRAALSGPARRMGACADKGVENSISILLDDSRCRMSRFHACPPGPKTGARAMVIAFLTVAGSRPAMSSDTLKDMFDLTATEACVAHLLASGLRPEEIARKTGVAPTPLPFICATRSPRPAPTARPNSSRWSCRCRCAPTVAEACAHSTIHRTNGAGARQAASILIADRNPWGRCSALPAKVSQHAFLRSDGRHARAQARLLPHDDRVRRR